MAATPSPCGPQADTRTAVHWPCISSHGRKPKVLARLWHRPGHPWASLGCGVLRSWVSGFRGPRSASWCWLASWPLLPAISVSKTQVASRQRGNGSCCAQPLPCYPLISGPGSLGRRWMVGQAPLPTSSANQSDATVQAEVSLEPVVLIRHRGLRGATPGASRRAPTSGQ